MAHARPTRAVGARLAALSVMPRRTFWQRAMRCGRGAGLGSAGETVVKERKKRALVGSRCGILRVLALQHISGRFADGSACLLRCPPRGFQRGASQQQNQDRRRAHAPASADTRRRCITVAAACLLDAAPRRYIKNVQAPARPRFGPGAQAPAARAGRPRRRDRPHHDRQGRRARVGYLWRVRSGWQSRQVRY